MTVSLLLLSTGYKSVDLIRSAWRRFVLIVQPLQFHYSQRTAEILVPLRLGISRADKECLAHNSGIKVPLSSVPSLSSSFVRSFDDWTQ